MRIKCSFTLEPEINANHQYAIELLKRWQWVENKREDEPETSQNRRSRFHRDLYLSGLVLYQLAPTLPGLLPQLLSEGNLTQGNMLNLLQASGFPYSEQNQGGLSDSQWDKLQRLISDRVSTPAQAAPQGAGLSPQHLEFGFTEVTKNIDLKLDKLIDASARVPTVPADLETKLEKLMQNASSNNSSGAVMPTELNVKLEQIAATTSQIATTTTQIATTQAAQGTGSSNAKAAASADVDQKLDQLLAGQNELLAQITSMPRGSSAQSKDISNRLAQVMQDQERILQQIRALKRDLKQGATLGGDASVAEDDDLPVDLEDQLSKAAKVKSKKLW